MKNRIINGNSLEFFNSDNSKKGEIKISGSDVIINPIDSSGTVIFGEEGTINDIEVGASGTPVDFTFLGGGTITPNGNTLTLGNSGDTIDLSNATIGTITASIFKGGQFIGDGSGLSSIPSTFTNITASGNISASGMGTFAQVRVGESTTTNYGLVVDYPETRLLQLKRAGSTIFRVTADSVDGQLDIFDNTGNSDIRLHADNDSYILNNLGVGTTSPDSKLTVAGDISASGNLIIGGTITAQEFKTEFISSSIIFESGSTQFGNSEDDVATFSGSVNIKDPGHITASGNISASGGVQIGFGTFSGTTDTKTDAAIVIPEDKAIYTLDSSGAHLRNLIRMDSDVIKIGQGPTVLIDEIRLQPGSFGFTSFYSASAEVARVDIDGNITASGNISASGDGLFNNVGIRTTPAQPLHVAGNARVDGDFFIIESNPQIFLSDSNHDSDFSINLNSGLFKITDTTNTADRITLDSSGNVGIGTTTMPNRLTISGSISASRVSAIRTYEAADSGLGPQLLLEGNMLGTSPAAGTLLELRSNIDFRGRGIHMTTATGSEGEEWFAGVPYKGAGYSIGYDSNNGLPWYKISSSLFIQESDLFVGVGTVLPKAKLHLSGSTSAQCAFRQSRAGRAIWDQAIDSSGRLQWGYRAAGSEGGTRTVSFTLDIDSRAGFGFNHDPAKLLHVSGGSGDAAILLEKSTNDATIESRTNSAGAYFKANSVGSSNYYGLELNNDTTGNWFLGSYGYADFSIVDGAKNSGTRHFTVKNTTGNVGIGTTAAPEKLTVEGNISASGNIITSGNITSSLFKGSQVNDNVDIGTETIATATGATASFFDYLAMSGSNRRAGTITAITDGSSVVINEVSTVDLGDTSGIKFSVVLTSGDLLLKATVASNDWEVKSIVRVP